MAGNTRLKELNTEVRRIDDLLEKNYIDLQSQIKHLKTDNLQRFERMQQMIAPNDANLAKIAAGIDKRPQQTPTSSSLTHGSTNSWHDNKGLHSSKIS